MWIPAKTALQSHLFSNPASKAFAQWSTANSTTMRGMRQAQPQAEKPKIPRRLPRSVRECCKHPEDDLGTPIDSWRLGSW